MDSKATFALTMRHFASFFVLTMAGPEYTLSLYQLKTNILTHPLFTLFFWGGHLHYCYDFWGVGYKITVTQHSSLSYLN